MNWIWSWLMTFHHICFRHKRKVTKSRFVFDEPCVAISTYKRNKVYFNASYCFQWFVKSAYYAIVWRRSTSKLVHFVLFSNIVRKYVWNSRKDVRYVGKIYVWYDKKDVYRMSFSISLENLVMCQMFCLNIVCLSAKVEWKFLPRD